MRIGVTSRIVPAGTYAEDRDALAQNWSQFLIKALPEAHWMSLPNLGADHIVTYCQGWGIDRVILSGGDDIGNMPLRDATELELLDWAEQCRIPVLGICRGMQVMAHRSGTVLIPVKDHAGTRHPVHGMRNGIVNSYHNLALAECPSDYEVLAKAGDGGIEAIRHSVLPWEGWMWHPEREPDADSQDIEAFRRIFL